MTFLSFKNKNQGKIQSSNLTKDKTKKAPHTHSFAFLKLDGCILP